MRLESLLSTSLSFHNFIFHKSSQTLKRTRVHSSMATQTQAEEEKDSSVVAFHIVGDAFVDLFSFLDADWPEKGGDAKLRSPIQTFAGGSSTNTATHLNALHSYFDAKHEFSADPVLHTTLNPNDLYGKILLKHATKHGFPLINCKQENDVSTTGHCVAIVAGQERSFMTYRGCVDTFHATHLDVDAIVGSCSRDLHLHIAGFFNLDGFQHGSIAHQIQHIRKVRTEKFPTRETVVSLVPQHDATKLWDGGIDELMPSLDFLIMNDLEALHIMQQGKKRATSQTTTISTAPEPTNGAAMATLVKDCAAYFHKKSPDTCVILTRGPTGAVALLNGKTIVEQDTVKVTPVDPTGAGDSFAAGFLHGLWAWRRKHSPPPTTTTTTTTTTNGGAGSGEPRQTNGCSWSAEEIRHGLVWGCAMGTSSVLTRGASIPSSREHIDHYRGQIEQLSANGKLHS